MRHSRSLAESPFNATAVSVIPGALYLTSFSGVATQQLPSEVTHVLCVCRAPPEEIMQRIDSFEVKVMGLGASSLLTTTHTQQRAHATQQRAHALTFYRPVATPLFYRPVATPLQRTCRPPRLEPRR